MRSRLLTLLLLAALAAFVYQYARDEERKVEPPPAGGTLFPGLETRDIDFVSLKFRTGHVVDFERKPQGPWKITFPTDEVAVPEFVEALVRNLADAKVLPIEEQGGAIDAAQVGLGPRAKNIVFGRGDQRVTLLIGEMNPLGPGVFAQLQGHDHIVLVTDNLFTMLDSFRAEDYVDKRLLRGLRGAIDQVRVEGPEGVLLDALLEGGEWVLREPVAALADSSRVSQLVGVLERAEYEYSAGARPLDSDLAKLGLPNSQQIREGDFGKATVLQLGAAGQSPVRAFLQQGWKEEESEVYVVREDLAKLLVFDRKHVNLLLQQPEFFRLRRVLPPVRERATAVSITVGEAALLSIARDERGLWTFLAPERLRGVRVDSERIEGSSPLSDFLGQLDALSVVGFLPAPPSQEPLAQLRIDWDWAGRSRSDRLELFDLSGSEVRALASARPTEGLVLGPEVLALLAPRVADGLRWLAPISVDEDTWGAFESHAPQGATSQGAATLRLERERAGTWQGDDAAGSRFGLAHDLLALRGLQWQEPPAGVEYPWRLEYLDFDGASLGRLELRGMRPDEPDTALGRPCVASRWSGVPDMELLVPAEVLDRIAALHAPATPR